MSRVRIPIPRAALAAFCERRRVRSLALFGSVLRDDFGPDSDVDVLVELRPGHGLTLYDWVDMRDELRALFGRDVDLVASSGLKNPLRRREILRTAEPVYGP